MITRIRSSVRFLIVVVASFVNDAVLKRPPHKRDDGDGPYRTDLTPPKPPLWRKWLTERKAKLQQRSRWLGQVCKNVGFYILVLGTFVTIARGFYLSCRGKETTATITGMSWDCKGHASDVESKMTSGTGSKATCLPFPKEQWGGEHIDVHYHRNFYVVFDLTLPKGGTRQYTITVERRNKNVFGDLGKYGYSVGNKWRALYYWYDGPRLVEVLPK